MRELNFFDSNIKFISEYSNNRVYFFDLQVDVVESKLITSLFLKPTHRHQYLYYLSGHPEHTKQSIIHSQTLRPKACVPLRNILKKSYQKRIHGFLKEGTHNT